MPIGYGFWQNALLMRLKLSTRALDLFTIVAMAFGLLSWLISACLIWSGLNS